MSDNHLQQISEQLINAVRGFATDHEDVFEILAFLKTRVVDHDAFVEYFMTTFQETHDDEGNLWLIATRYWDKAISSYAANILFEQARKTKL